MISLIDIARSNEAVKFIERRIKFANYRNILGISPSQHNRYDMEHVHSLLSLLLKINPNNELLVIRTKDTSKRPQNTKEEILYEEFCSQVRQARGKGTQDSIRKNLFVDWHRMGFIVRYNNKKIENNPFKKQINKYVRISKLGLSFIKAEDMLERYLLYTKGIDSLLGGYVSIIHDLFSNYSTIKKITIYDFMFFITAIGMGNYGISMAECASHINDFNKLMGMSQKEGIIEQLKISMNPKGVNTTKTEKRDFYNWYNMAQQCFSLLNQTVFFEVSGKDLRLRINASDSEYEFSKISDQIRRSSKEKEVYFKKHSIQKKKGFELHHVIPLSHAESVSHFALLDKWENMIYIDGFTHAFITQNRNRYLIMSKSKDNKEDIILKDYSADIINLEKDKNIIYDIKYKHMMIDTNLELRKITEDTL